MPDGTIKPIDRATIDQAARLLLAGEVVAFPTETVYGLGAVADDDRAVAKIFAAKARPQFNPLIVHLAEPKWAMDLVTLDRRADALIERFWPGPLSLVLPRTAGCPASLLCSAGLDSLAVRMPSHPAAADLLRAVGRAVAAPSANRSGQVSPTRAAHVAESLGAQVSLILDGGSCTVGLESSVVDLTGATPRLLRPGAVTREALGAVLGVLESPQAGEPLKSPGQLTSHYAPRHPLRLEARQVSGDEALLAFGPHPLPGAAHTLNLSAEGDLVEAAANLFAALRSLDRTAVSGIAVMPVPESGLGTAINDRLRRAAAPRPA